MSAHRYWRIHGFMPTGGSAALELGELQLWSAGARVDGSATITCNVAPSTGSLSALSDGAASPTVTFSRALVDRGIQLVYDLGSAFEVQAVKIAGGAAQSTFPLRFVIQGSDDATTFDGWELDMRDLVYPGASTISSQIARRVAWSRDNSPAMGYSNDDMTSVGATGSPIASAPSEAFRRAGKWYFEVLFVSGVSGNNSVGLVPHLPPAADALGSAGVGYAYIGNGQSWIDGSLAAFGASYGAGDVVGVAVDLDAGSVWFAKNNTWQAGGSPSTGTAPAGTFASATRLGPAWNCRSAGAAMTLRSSHQDLTYAPPTGFTAWDGSSTTGLTFTSPSLAQPLMSMRLTSTIKFPGGLITTPIVFTTTPWIMVDTMFGGPGSISGTLKVAGTPDAPIARAVWLMDTDSGYIVRSTISDAATGAYSFSNLNRDFKYMVMGIDRAHNFRPTAADNITPD